MESHYSAQPGKALTRALVCGCLLGICLSAIAQTSENQEEEAASPVLPEQVTEEPAPVVLPEQVTEEPAPVVLPERDAEELAPVILPDRGLQDESSYDEPLFDDESDSLSSALEASSETYEQTLQRLFFAYKEAVLGSMFEEADTLAKQIVELSIEVNGLDSPRTATALTNLAVAQHGMEEYQSAILNYTAAIGIIERIEDRLASNLINPLRGLGAAYFATGRPDLAKDAFERAVHISHVNDGPHNLDQIEILQSLTETYLSVGEVSDAVNIQKRIYYLQARNIPSKSLDIIPALQTRANWQRRLSLYEQERFTRRRIIKVIEVEKGKDSLALIQPLTELANSYLAVLYVNVPARAQPAISSGEPYLKRAIRIAERNPDSTLQIRVDSKLELADYYILTDRAGRAHTLYRSIWDLLSEDESLLDMRASMLESGVLLKDISPPKMLDEADDAAGGSKPPGYRSGTVLFGYTSNTRGRVTNVRLLEADPKGLDSLYKQIGRELRFLVRRPRLVDGVAVASDNLTFAHDFFYRDADLEEYEKETKMVTETSAPE